MALTDRAEKKLKRGLEDLSPLFQKKPSSPSAPVSLPAPLAEPLGVQFISVCMPDHEGDAFLVNAYLASQLVREAEVSASLISIHPSHSHSVEHLDPRISRLHFSHEEIWSLTQNGSFQPERSRASGATDRSLVFLELESAQLRALARATLLLDRVILFVQPEADSLQEGYRLIKSLWQLNHDLEFFLLFRGPVAPEERKGFLFERFSLITSRFLGFSPGWLGELGFPEGKNQTTLQPGKTPGFDSARIFSSAGLHRPLSPEKGRFWQEVQRIQNGGTGSVRTGTRS